jgi:hypothetical protein
LLKNTLPNGEGLEAWSMNENWTQTRRNLIKFYGGTGILFGARWSVAAQSDALQQFSWTDFTAPIPMMPSLDRLV